MLRAVIFDFDGVIANSEPLHFQAFRDVLAAKGVELTEHDYYTRYLGFDDSGAFGAISGERGLRWHSSEISELVSRKAVIFEALEMGDSVLFPGVRELIARLASALPLGIASGARREEIERVLEHSALRAFFRALVAAEDTLASKPAPDPYRLVVEQLGTAIGEELLPGECVAIEDSRWGLESASAAGLRCVGVMNSYPASELPGAELVVEGLNTLTLAMLEQLVARPAAAGHYDGRESARA